MGLVWTGGIDDLRAKPETADTKYVIPEDGTLYWMDTWVIFKDPPHPNSAYAFLNFIQDTGHPGPGDGDQPVRHGQPRGGQARAVRRSWNNPTIFVPADVLASGKLEGAEDVSTDPLRRSRSGRSSRRRSGRSRDRDDAGRIGSI